MIVDYTPEGRPNKAAVRSTVVNVAPRKIRTAILLPSVECLDIQELMRAGKIDAGTKLIVAERDPERHAMMLKKLDDLGLQKNVLIAKMDSIETLTPDEVPDDLDFVNLDLEGCLGIHTLKWIHEVIVPKIKGIFTVTYLQSYRTHSEVPIMLQQLREQKDLPSGLVSYAEFYAALSRRELHIEDREAYQLYIAQYHYILTMVFENLFPTIQYDTYNDTRSHMCIWVADINKKYWFRDDKGLPRKMPSFINFYDKVVALLPDRPPVTRESTDLQGLVTALIEMEKRHHAENMELMQKILAAVK